MGCRQLHRYHAGRSDNALGFLSHDLHRKARGEAQATLNAFKDTEAAKEYAKRFESISQHLYPRWVASVFSHQTFSSARIRDIKSPQLNMFLRAADKKTRDLWTSWEDVTDMIDRVLGNEHVQ